MFFVSELSFVPFSRIMQCCIDLLMGQILGVGQKVVLRDR